MLTALRETLKESGLDEAAIGEKPLAELLEKLEPFRAALNGSLDQPPESWRPWLEPLIKEMEAAGSLDLDALLRSASSQRKPPTSRRPASKKRRK